MSGWWRAWIGMASDPKWLAIGRRAGVAPGMALSVAIHLIERAAEAEDRGSFAGYDAEAIGCFVGCEEDEVEAIVSALAAKGMTEGERFTAWERRQPKREDDSHERVRAFRARQRAAADGAEEGDAKPAPARAGKAKAAEGHGFEGERSAVTQRNAPEADAETEKKEAAAVVNNPAGEAAAAAVSSLGDEREKREASASPFTAEAVTLHRWICEEARSPNGWRGDLGIVRGWLDAGFSAEEIRGGVAAVLARERGQLPTSLRYFEGAIGDQRSKTDRSTGARSGAAPRPKGAGSPVIDWTKADAAQWRKPLDLWARMRRERGADERDWPDWARWRPGMGPPPDRPGCLAPAALIAEVLAAAGLGMGESEPRRAAGGQR